MKAPERRAPPAPQGRQPGFRPESGTARQEGGYALQVSVARQEADLRQLRQGSRRLRLDRGGCAQVDKDLPSVEHGARRGDASQHLCSERAAESAAHLEPQCPGLVMEVKGAAFHATTDAAGGAAVTDFLPTRGSCFGFIAGRWSAAR